MATVIKKEQANTASAEIKKGIQNHKAAAKHHEAAAKCHHEAAKHHEAGNHKKACECTVKAYGHHCMASDALREDVKHHALVD